MAEHPEVSHHVGLLFNAPARGPDLLETGHRDDPAFGLELLDFFALLTRKQFGEHFINAQLPCHRLGRAPTVAGQHNDPQPVLMEQANRFRGRVVDFSTNASTIATNYSGSPKKLSARASNGVGTYAVAAGESVIDEF